MCAGFHSAIGHTHRQWMAVDRPFCPFQSFNLTASLTWMTLSGWTCSGEAKASHAYRVIRTRVISIEGLRRLRPVTTQTDLVGRWGTTRPLGRLVSLTRVRHALTMPGPRSRPSFVRHRWNRSRGTHAVNPGEKVYSPPGPLRGV